MTGADYLPAGLPHNRAAWPQEYQILEHYDLRAAGLIRQLYEKRIPRGTVTEALKNTPDNYREFFRDRLNYWRGEREK
ncbi:hypothetical protein PPV52_000568 [Escherichia coli O103]|jgi:hypothetical protein|uniref:Uncharacterized protein n=3 Tax=Escherichia coli TaxID=562 RepID=A0A0M1TQU1_ECOLX|nr:MULTISPECIES: hypothetical protein [Escherichia]EKK9163123.1 hypothetical protein [Escherichia coli O103]DAN34118.1 MAG TPA: DNA polymerase III [Bacteriophage sp.]ABV16516.1 hypothetical protein EcE24377A_2246 [Escherichia coli O139:H28 str. E24377A]AIZ83038.1 hypothetical protein HW42_14355 [Escherichia coli]ASL32607.1 hypothetical protein CEJ55_19145 [Escherichia coli]